MTCKINFNMVSPYNYELTKDNANTLKRYGFEIIDLREAEIICDPEDSIGGKWYVHILCCRGNQCDYDRFKELYKLEEIIYEGKKTLI